MPEYKLYCLDGAKRIARAADVLRAESDEQAVAAARGLGRASACEIWQGRRLVATIPSAKPSK
ncbi:hypothetical protein [Sphingomonas sp.]|uniref:hypothetical protein n=1 Tax=Sphingomonas sp. TaxID=28214 RepID=UPI0018321215|nr:hypothetical protein [Sphingomonas sp.]MBA3512223.1 hypothetical protein [Sphingomonas sp.]